MLTIFLVLHALIAFSVADVSHLTRQYLPPTQALDHNIKPQHQQQQNVQLKEVLHDEATNGDAHAVTDVQQSLDNEKETLTSDGASSEAASDPFTQPGLVGFGGFPGARPAFPGQGFPAPTVPISVYVGQYPGSIYPGEGFAGQGFPGQGFPGQVYPGQVYPGQVYPGQGFPGQVYPGQGFIGQGLIGQGFPGQGFAGQGFPGQGFPGQGFPIPYQTSSEQHPVDFNTASASGSDVRDQKTRLIASDTIYGENGGYVYDKPK